MHVPLLVARRAWCSLSAAIALVVVACAPPAPTTQAPGQAATPAAAATQPTAWVVANNEEPPALDPNFGSTTSAAGGLIYRHLYDALLDFEALPDGTGFKIVPLLAESYRVIDDTTWEFKLRKGVKFSNGNELNAEDVKYTFDDYASDKTLRTNIKNAIDRVEVVDPSTIRFHTRGVHAELLGILSDAPIMSRARAQVGAEAHNLKPIGTGAFRVLEWQKGDHLTMEANPDYWRGRVTPQKLTIRFIADPTTRVAELKSGGVQIIASPAAGQLRELETDANIQLLAMRQIGKGGRAMHFIINATKKPYDDVRVRQAINYAVDRESILKNVLEGRGELLRGPFSSGWPGFDASLAMHPYDPAKARQLLTEAGLANGFETELTTSDGIWLKDREVAEAISSYLDKVGVKARIVPREVVKLFTDRLNGNFEGIIMTPWATYHESDSMLTIHFYRAKYENDETLNGLIEKQRQVLDPEARTKAQRDVGRYIHDQAYLLEVHSQDEYWAARKSIDWKPQQSGGTYQMLFMLTPR
jgi:peptide/nickel transport system substrate-binding protein